MLLFLHLGGLNYLAEIFQGTKVGAGDVQLSQQRMCYCSGVRLRSSDRSRSLGTQRILICEFEDSFNLLCEESRPIRFLLVLDQQLLQLIVGISEFVYCLVLSVVASTKRGVQAARSNESIRRGVCKPSSSASLIATVSVS